MVNVGREVYQLLRDRVLAGPMGFIGTVQLGRI